MIFCFNKKILIYILFFLISFYAEAKCDSDVLIEVDRLTVDLQIFQEPKGKIGEIPEGSPFVETHPSREPKIKWGKVSAAEGDIWVIKKDVSDAGRMSKINPHNPAKLEVEQTQLAYKKVKELKIDNINIPRVKLLNEGTLQPELLTEFLPGRPLKELALSGNKSLIPTKEEWEQFKKSMSKLHDAGAVHGDLSGNVLFHRDPNTGKAQFNLIDFDGRDKDYKFLYQYENLDQGRKALKGSDLDDVKYLESLMY